MRGYGLFYYISEAFHGLRANSLVNLLAVGTISMAMLIVGFFLLVFFNLRPVVNALGDRLEISVYLKDALTEHEKDFLVSRLKAEPGVRKVVYLSKADALAVFKKELKGQEALIQGLGENPLPDSYEVSIDRPFADADKLEALSKKFSGYPGVEDVSYGKRGAEVLSGLFKLITYGGTALAVLLGPAGALLPRTGDRAYAMDRGNEGLYSGAVPDRGHDVGHARYGARNRHPRRGLLCSAPGGCRVPGETKGAGLFAAFSGSIYDNWRRLSRTGRRTGLGEQVPGVAPHTQWQSALVATVKPAAP
jgi:hypothetical protein